jgi:hypothetical protein
MEKEERTEIFESKFVKELILLLIQFCKFKKMKNNN